MVTVQNFDVISDELNIMGICTSEMMYITGSLIVQSLIYSSCYPHEIEWNIWRRELLVISLCDVFLLPVSCGGHKTGLCNHRDPFSLHHSNTTPKLPPKPFISSKPLPPPAAAHSHAPPPPAMVQFNSSQS